VELWKNYCPVVPVEFNINALYAEPDGEIMSRVKDEKLFRAESREVLMAKKYRDREKAVKDVAFGDVV
jgi:hypothetical protein